jgi:dolichol-phosphate mannosyltransferase
MDCDLQDQPEEIPKLYEAAQTGYDIVVGIRTDRKDTFFKRATSRLFYRVFDYFTGTKVKNSIANFGIYSRKAVLGICSLREQHRSFGLFAIWVGFRRLEIHVAHAHRGVGETSYTFQKLVRLAMDSILAHSNTLLWMSVKLGLLISVSSMLMGLWLIIRYLSWGVPLAGWTSLMVTIFFSTGLIIGKIFDEVKGRPLYIIDSTTFDSQIPSKYRTWNRL